MRLCILELVLFSAISSVSFASVSWGPIISTPWRNPACLNGQDCGLQEFNLRQQSWVADYTDRYPEEAQKLGGRVLNFGTTVFYEYRTTAPEQLQDYVVVNFIRGCMFRSEEMPDGTIDYSHIFARDLLGRLAVFQHPEWHVDSIDTDPMYKNEVAETLAQDPQTTRHDRWEWTQDAASFDQDQATPYGMKKPLMGRLFASDRPGTAFRMSSAESKNVSLQFKACIYSAKQVPSAIAEANRTDFGPPIACHEWSHNKIFDHQKKVFESPSEISPICLGRPLQVNNLKEEGGAYYYQ